MLKVTGIAVERPSWIVPGDVTGTENFEAPYDANYGKLLDRVGEKGQKGSCARRESNPRPTGSKPVALSI